MMLQTKGLDTKTDWEGMITTQVDKINSYLTFEKGEEEDLSDFDRETFLDEDETDNDLVALPDGSLVNLANRKDINGIDSFEVEDTQGNTNFVPASSIKEYLPMAIKSDPKAFEELIGTETGTPKPMSKLTKPLRGIIESLSERGRAGEEEWKIKPSAIAYSPPPEQKQSPEYYERVFEQAEDTLSKTNKSNPPILGCNNIESTSF